MMMLSFSQSTQITDFFHNHWQYSHQFQDIHFQDIFQKIKNQLFKIADAVG